MLRDALQRVLNEYRRAVEHDAFADHPLADHLRHRIPNLLASATPDAGTFLFKGSVGTGNWAACPWVAVLDPDVCTTVQTGFYPVYLFSEDMAAVTLSLNQGVRRLIGERGAADARAVLQARAHHYRALLGVVPASLGLSGPIDLAAKSPSQNAAFYELGHICGARYESGRLPEEDDLLADYHSIVALYQTLAASVDPETETDSLEAEPETEDYTRWRMHKRLDRNPQLAARAKQHHGYVCEACGINMEALYGVLGRKYIEAHHLVPVSQLVGRVLRRDPHNDFAVLCPNCHRMIHRTESPHDLQGLRDRLRRDEFKRIGS